MRLHGQGRPVFRFRHPGLHNTNKARPAHNTNKARPAQSPRRVQSRPEAGRQILHRFMDLKEVRREPFTKRAVSLVPEGKAPSLGQVTAVA